MVSGKRQHRRSLAIVCLLCTTLVLACYIFWPRYRRLEWRVRDQLAIYGKRAEPHPDLVFLAIDNASATLDLLFDDERISDSPALRLIKETGFPYRRDVYPLIIERLISAGARVVALDIMFPGEKETDPPFAAALERYRKSVVIGANLESRDIGAYDDKERFGHTLVSTARSLIAPPKLGMDDRVGYVNFWPDEEDSVVRRARYRTTALELAGHSHDPTDPELVSLSARILEKSGHADRIPSKRGQILFRFVQQIRPVSLYQIFVPRIWERPPFNNGTFFQNKIVLIGPDGNWVKDELPTPFGAMVGPRLHLSMVNAALRDDFLRETSGQTNLVLIVASGILAWGLGRFIQQPLIRFVILIGVIAAIYGLAQFAFNTAGFYPLLLSPLLALASSGVTFSIVEQVLDRLEKARLRRTFERYVSRDVVKELVDNPESFLNLQGGVRKNITVLFSDVRGFTTMTETADAAQLVTQLNEYFTEMVRIVFEHQGTLDKFIGDAVMAHWGSIVSEGEKTDACRAVSSALDMKRALQKLNEGWKPRGMIELHFGIGINHGEAIVGNLGSEEKKEVSAIGDPVNLASRLEGVTKSYRLDLCIGEKVEALVRDTFITRSVDLIVVKGKTRPAGVFTVLTERGNGAQEPAWLAIHEEAMRLYRAGQFAPAAERWHEVLAAQPGDPIAELFIQRCADLQQNPPEGAWHGVYEMKSK